MKAKEIFKRIYVWVAENRIKTAILVALILIGLLLIPCIRTLFFGEKVYPEKIITYIGAAFGGTILLFQLMENSKRNKNMEISNQNIVKTNEIAERGQINTRFKDAAMLLGSKDTASILSGIYALHQIAMECHKGKEEQKGYVKVINDILCAYIRESVGEDEKGEKICTRPTVLIQTIIDVLFKNKGDIYREYKSDLRGAVFVDVSFNNARLKKVDFGNASLRRVYFIHARLMKVHFNSASLSYIYFGSASLMNVKFKNASLRDVDFRVESMKFVSFSHTVLAPYSQEEIIKRSRELTAAPKD